MITDESTIWVAFFALSGAGTAIISYPHVTLTRGWTGTVIFLIACLLGGPFIMVAACLALVAKWGQNLARGYEKHREKLIK